MSNDFLAHSEITQITDEILRSTLDKTRLNPVSVQEIIITDILLDPMLPTEDHDQFLRSFSTFKEVNDFINQQFLPRTHGV